MEQPTSWAERILAARQKLGWTQADMARELDVQLMTVSRWERGVAEPRATTRRRVERWLREHLTRRRRRR
jgi:transcriptional regulator with XRE-family HTH domain